MATNESLIDDLLSAASAPFPGRGELKAATSAVLARMNEPPAQPAAAPPPDDCAAPPPDDCAALALATRRHSNDGADLYDGEREALLRVEETLRQAGLGS